MEATQAFEDIQPASERTQIIPVTERVVAIDGETGLPTETEAQSNVFVRPLPFRRWLKAMGIVGQLFQYFPQEEIDFDDPAKLAVTIVNLLGNAENEVIALACLATDKDPDFFDRIDADAGVQIITSVVTVNKDFFVQKVLPLLNQHRSTLTETFGQTQ